MYKKYSLVKNTGSEKANRCHLFVLVTWNLAELIIIPLKLDVMFYLSIPYCYKLDHFPVFAIVNFSEMNTVLGFYFSLMISIWGIIKVGV